MCIASSVKAAESVRDNLIGSSQDLLVLRYRDQSINDIVHNHSQRLPSNVCEVWQGSGGVKVSADLPIPLARLQTHHRLSSPTTSNAILNITIINLLLARSL
jgi:hypothetical protein